MLAKIYQNIEAMKYNWCNIIKIGTVSGCECFFSILEIKMQKEKWRPRAKHLVLHRPSLMYSFISVIQSWCFFKKNLFLKSLSVDCGFLESQLRNVFCPAHVYFWNPLSVTPWMAIGISASKGESILFTSKQNFPDIPKPIGLVPHAKMKYVVMQLNKLAFSQLLG